MTDIQDSSSRARLIRQMARNSSRRTNSTTSSINSHASAHSAAHSDFDPENEAIMSTQQFEKSPVLQPLQGKQYLRPEPAYSFDKEALRRILPESDDGLSQSEDESIEIGRGYRRSDRIAEDSRNDDSMSTPPLSALKDSRKRQSSRDLRKDAQVRLASIMSHKENVDPIENAPNSRTSRPQIEKRIRKTLGEMHTKATETYDGSLIADERPPTVTFTTKNTRFGSGTYPNAKETTGKDNLRQHVNATETVTVDDNQSYMLPDLPNLSELVSGIYQDGLPVFARTGSNKSRFGAIKRAKMNKVSGHRQLEALPIPDDEKAIFVSLKLLQDKVAELEVGKAKAEQELEEVKAANTLLQREQREKKQYRRSDSALGTSDEDEGQVTVSKYKKLEHAHALLQDKLNSISRKAAVNDVAIKNLAKERDAATAQLGVAFLSIEELKAEKQALTDENESLRAQLAQISSFLQHGISEKHAHSDKRHLNYGSTSLKVHEPSLREPSGAVVSPAKDRQKRVVAQVNDQLSKISGEQNNDALFSLGTAGNGERNAKQRKGDRRSLSKARTTRDGATGQYSMRERGNETLQQVEDREPGGDADINRTYLSLVEPDYISRLRRIVEEARIARKTGRQQTVEDEIAEATSKSTGARSAYVPDRTLPRKSSMKTKDSNAVSHAKMTNTREREPTTTQLSRGRLDNATEIEDTAESTQQRAPVDRFNSEPTVTGVSAISNTSRRRYRPAFADENMTSAFILPDITIARTHNRTEATKGHTQEDSHGNPTHDGTNCIVCQRILQEAHRARPGAADSDAPSKETVSVSRPVPASNRVPAPTDSNPDPTVRPSQPPSLALAIAIKTLEDELSHIKLELDREQMRYNSTDPSLSRRERKRVGLNIQKLLKTCEHKADLIYALYDVLEGQKKSGTEMTQDEVEVTLMNLKDVVERKGTSNAKIDLDIESDEGSDFSDDAEDDLPEDEEWNGLPESTHTNTQNVGGFAAGRGFAV